MSSFSTEEKLDLLIKKIAFGKAKTETSENTDPFGEATASPLLLRADKLWREAGSIPTSPPGADTSQVELYTGADTVQCTAVSAAQNTNISGFKRSWTTGQTDWIPPEFGANYLVKVYVGPAGWNGTDAVATTVGGTNGTSTGAQVFQVEPGNDTAEWYFDYQAGILYWVNENESGTLGASTSLTGSIAGTDKVYIQGYKYIGDFGVGGGIELTDFDVTQNAASGTGTLTYDEAGEFTYTPPLLTGFQSTITGGATTIVSDNLGTSLALVSDASGKVAVSDVTATELGYLDGVTSGIQAQINSKQATITGGATTIVSDNLGASLALVSDGSGKVAVSDVTATELGHLDGVTSGIQAQINAKQATITGGATTIVSDNLGASLALVSDASGKVAVSDVTATELGYLDGVTSGIQAQINAKQATITGGATTIVSDNLTASKALVSDASGKVGVSAVTSAELGYVAGVTSAIQTQINAKLTANASITGATKTKITYDANGLVTAGADLTADDIPDISGTYLTSETFTNVGVAEGTDANAHKVVLTTAGNGETVTGVQIDTNDLTFTPSSTADRGKLTTGDLLVKGDFTVLGGGTIINLQQENIYMKDAIITLGNADDALDADYDDAAELATDIGIEAFKKGYVTDDANKYPKVVFDHSASVWAVNNWSHAASVENKIAEKFVSDAYAWTEANVTAGYAEITHNLNTKRILVQVTNDSDEIVYVKFIANDLQKAKIYIAAATAGDAFDIVIIG